MEAFGNGGRDFLSDGADLDAMNVAVFAQAVIDKIDDARRGWRSPGLRCLRLAKG